MKLTTKLTLAFLSVSIAAFGLSAVFIWFMTKTQFSQFLIDQREANFIEISSNYYKKNGHWNGVDEALQSAGLLPPPVSVGETPPDPQPFALVDQSRVVIVSGGQYMLGQKVKQGILDRGISIEIGNVVVGTVIKTGEIPASNTIEQRYIDQVNNSLIIAAAGSGILALFLGILMAKTLTRSLRRLTVATREVAFGKIAEPVDIRSKDEIGELACAFNQMNSDLSRLNQARKQMTADIAHDLRSPLTVIGGYLEAILEGKLVPSPDRILIMLQEVNHLENLIEDLRTLSLADAGELHLDLTLTSPGILLDKAASSFEYQAEQQEISIIVEKEEELPEILMDKDRMELVVGNLLSNALRYTPRGGEIRLIGSKSGETLILQVIDSGCGISPEVLPHVFERSYRGDISRNSDQSGLGLAIAKSIVELHGGTIQVASQGSGKGCQFTIILPIRMR